MQKLIPKIKGTKDLFGKDIIYHDKVIDCFEKICNFFFYQKISTPIIEHSSTFIKSLGLTSDIISKEMYSFIDKGGDSIVLRPEGTAAVARALISNSLQEESSKKFYYSGPMFRRERPQKGRFRQFHQIGVEYFGEINFLYDTEVILVAEKLINFLGIKKKLKLQINSLGNLNSRKKYIKVLQEFLSDNFKRLSDLSQKRFKENPLRILDSKDPSDRKLLKLVPSIIDSLDEESSNFFESLLDHLKKLKIDFNINPNLVRGLDYYNHTAFEYVTKDEKSQNAVLAGGRYDGLVKSLGGNDISGVGWAAGIERIILNLSEEKDEKIIICFFSLNNKNNVEVIRIIQTMKIQDRFSINFLSTGNLKKKLNKANKIGSRGCILLGEKEWGKKMLVWKDFSTGQQENFHFEKINDFLINKLIKN